MIYYGIRNTTYGHHHPAIGEQWTDWSWTELAGFGLLVTGLFVYRGIVELPGFKYGSEEPKSDSVRDLKPETDNKNE
jgi:hypothetical protein